jgi:hypothetical protein
MTSFGVIIVHGRDDWQFSTTLASALIERGISARLPGGETEIGRDGFVFVLSRGLDPFWVATFTTYPELLPFVVVPIDDSPVPLPLRDAPLIEGRGVPVPEIANAIQRAFAAVLPLPPEELATPPSGELGALRRAATVFISYAREDSDNAVWLHGRLRADGFEAWMDKANLGPGQQWEYEIRKAIRSAAAVLICLSRSAVDKFGYFQKEISLALDIADEAPEGRAFIIPIRLDDCVIPERLRRWQWADGVGIHSYGKIVDTLDGILKSRFSGRRS